jgi:hypothetical protein
MKRTVGIIAALAISLAVSSVSFAQTPAGVGNLSQYLANRRQVSHQLGADPQPTSVHAYAANQADRLAMYRQWREDGYRRGRYGGVTPGRVARFDNGYLDQHPRVSRQLARHPRLVDSPRYLQAHPRLDRYFDSHPGVRASAQNHPYRFRAGERRYERWEHGRATIAGGSTRLANWNRMERRHPE